MFLYLCLYLHNVHTHKIALNYIIPQTQRLIPTTHIKINGSSKILIWLLKGYNDITLLFRWLLLSLLQNILVTAHYLYVKCQLQNQLYQLIHLKYLFSRSSFKTIWFDWNNMYVYIFFREYCSKSYLHLIIKRIALDSII